MSRPASAWWQSGVIYELYPRSFQDTNGDGIGDLEGIRRRLDYLAWLGIDAVWITPIYRSPMADGGYDISDYRDIDPIFGTREDFDRLLTEAHARGLKVILDFVPNHTSDQHAWFVESRSSRDNPRRNWYLWRDPAPDGGPPNNWRSNFGGSGWEFDATTGQYYYHAFLKEQPDLNWRNPDVRKAMYEILRYWLDRGVDGFRVDVLWLLIKDDEFRDNPPNPAWQPDQPDIDRLLQRYSADRPEVHDVVAEIRSVLDAYPDRVFIGEVYLPIERLVSYYGRDMKGAHLPFNFQLIFAAWTAADVTRIIREYEAAVPRGGTPSWVLSNHDQKRVATRLGASEARVGAMLLLTLRGTPTIYYGDELGLTDVSIPPDRVQDRWEKNEPGFSRGRDPARTPMPWDAAPNAGFTTGTPWLPLNPDYQSRNVAALSADPRSILNLHRRLIELRRHHPALRLGGLAIVDAPSGLLAFERSHADNRLLIVLSFVPEQREFHLPPDTECALVLLSTCLDREDQYAQNTLHVRRSEGVILQLLPGERAPP